MQQIIDIGEIRARAANIGLRLSDLAAAAGIHKSTAYRVAQGSDTQLSTARALSAALVREERRLLGYLQALHPDQVGAGEQEAA